MRSLLAAAAAVDAALDALGDPELTHAPGRKHWAEARRLLVDVRGEIMAGLDLWRVVYPEASDRLAGLSLLQEVADAPCQD